MTEGTARIAVLGPGGIGGLLAVRLGRAGHDVTLIGRHPDRVTAAGLTLTAPGEDAHQHHARLPARISPSPSMS